MYKINSLSEFYFLLGLIVYTVGQFLIFIVFNDIDALHAQEPIDFAHWFMLIGALLLIPQIGNFPKTKLNLFSTPVLVLGIGLIIGMCVLDFVFWGLNSPDLKREVAKELINTPAIWTPFMSVSGEIFTFGLFMFGCSYFKETRLGVALIAAGMLVVYLPWGWDNIPGYLLITLGFYISFGKRSLVSEIDR